MTENPDLPCDWLSVAVYEPLGIAEPLLLFQCCSESNATANYTSLSSALEQHRNNESIRNRGPVSCPCATFARPPGGLRAERPHRQGGFSCFLAGAARREADRRDCSLFPKGSTARASRSNLRHGTSPRTSAVTAPWLGRPLRWWRGPSRTGLRGGAPVALWSIRDGSARIALALPEARAAGCSANAPGFFTALRPVSAGPRGAWRSRHRAARGLPWRAVGV